MLNPTEITVQSISMAFPRGEADRGSKLTTDFRLSPSIIFSAWRLFRHRDNINFIFDKNNIIVWPTKFYECIPMLQFGVPQTEFREELLSVVLVNIPDRISISAKFPRFQSQPGQLLWCTSYHTALRILWQLGEWEEMWQHCSWPLTWSYIARKATHTSTCPLRVATFN